MIEPSDARRVPLELLFEVDFDLGPSKGEREVEPVEVVGAIDQGLDAVVRAQDVRQPGLARTGRVVTAAAILMAVAIGAFSTSSISFIQQIGVATATGVLVDAFVVRTLLVPSLMTLLGRANWWLPAWLDRLTSSLAWRAWWRTFGMIALLYVGWAAVAGSGLLLAGSADLTDSTSVRITTGDETDFQPTRRKVATNLTIRYDRDAGAFKGSVGSSRKRCQTGRAVTLKKKRKGRPNRVVGNTTSNRKGNWAIFKNVNRGRYYAVAAVKRFTAANGDTIKCLRDRSVTIKV